MHLIKRITRFLEGGEARRRFADIPEWQRMIRNKVRPYTMTSDERIYALIQSVEYIVRNEIRGDMVECGVWRGGCSMAIALTLEHFGSVSRNLFLFDTFSGMTPPGNEDLDYAGSPASKRFAKLNSRPEEGGGWSQASLSQVQHAMQTTMYPAHLVHYIKGPVEKTIPHSGLESIALLRLDTDWYASTKHELIHLYPRVSDLGMVHIDDYGHWQGARQAMDEYIRENSIQCYLHRIDYTGREFLKLPLKA